MPLWRLSWWHRPENLHIHLGKLLFETCFTVESLTRLQQQQQQQVKHSDWLNTFPPTSGNARDVAVGGGLRLVHRPQTSPHIKGEVLAPPPFHNLGVVKTTSPSMPAKSDLQTCSNITGDKCRRRDLNPDQQGEEMSILLVSWWYFLASNKKNRKKKKHRPYGCCSLPVPAYKNKTPPRYYLWHGCLISTKCCRW